MPVVSLHEALMIVTGGFSVLAALFWCMSAFSEVPASGKGGIGPGFDGYLVGLNGQGKPIDLIPSMQRQFRWNGRAALCAAAAAGCQFIDVLASLHK
jgi:hypothetical protein